MKDFVKLLSQLKSSAEAREMSELIFTRKEREILEMRIAILKLLLSEEASHREIAAALKVSISKVTAGSKATQTAPGKVLVKFKKVYNI